MFLAKLKTAALITAACVAVTGTGVVVAQRVAEPARPGNVKLSDLITVTRGLDGLQARWIGAQSPQQMGRFATATPRLNWKVAPASGLGNFWLVGTNESERDKQGIWEFKVRATPDSLWLSAAHGTQALNAWLEYIQKPGEVRLIRTGWRDGRLDPAQRVDLRAASLAALKAQSGEQVRQYLGPLLAHFNAAALLDDAGKPAAAVPEPKPATEASPADGPTPPGPAAETPFLRERHPNCTINGSRAVLVIRESPEGVVLFTPWCNVLVKGATLCGAGLNDLEVRFAGNGSGGQGSSAQSADCRFTLRHDYSDNRLQLTFNGKLVFVYDNGTLICGNVSADMANGFAGLMTIDLESAPQVQVP